MLRSTTGCQSELFETQQGNSRLSELHLKKQYFLYNFCSLPSSSAPSPEHTLLYFVASLFIVIHGFNQFVGASVLGLIFLNAMKMLGIMAVLHQEHKN